MTYKELVNLANYSTEQYNEGNPIMSDKEWDDLYFKIREFEVATGVVDPESPTQAIHFEIVDKLKKNELPVPMLSLNKTKDGEEFLNYFGIRGFIVTPKLDGLSACLEYEGGRLVRATTRGNGTIGEDITHNVKVIKNVPKTIVDKNPIIVLGEIICPVNVFDEYFSSDYKNPRNFAAGSIRLLDSEESYKRQLKFVAWDIRTKEEIPTFEIGHDYLKILGFEAVPIFYPFYPNAESFEGFIERAKDISRRLNYPIDGLVGRFNDLTYGESLGYTAHHPNHSLAFKFYDEEVVSTLKDVVYEPSRNGILTPVAIFEPVELEGSTVSRASLHNMTIFADFLTGGEEVHVGDTLTIIKANQIIPQIINWEPTGKGKKIEKVPKICPACGHETLLKESDTGVQVLYCSNEQCSSRLINRLEHFVSKECLDIKGLSKQTLSKLLDWGWINDELDIFSLKDHKEEWIKKDGFGQKSVENILTAIEQSKEVPLHRFIAALGIPLVGTKAAKDIAEFVCSYQKFRESKDFLSVDGIGYETNKALAEFDYSKADKLAQILNIVNCEKKETPKTGLKVAITGKLSGITRKELINLIESKGGNVMSSVSKNTDYLIADQPENSSKYQNAQKFNIKILPAKVFIETVIN